MEREEINKVIDTALDLAKNKSKDYKVRLAMKEKCDCLEDYSMLNQEIKARLQDSLESTDNDMKMGLSFVSDCFNEMMFKKINGMTNDYTFNDSGRTAQELREYSKQIYEVADILDGRQIKLLLNKADAHSLSICQQNISGSRKATYLESARFTREVLINTMLGRRIEQVKEIDNESENTYYRTIKKAELAKEIQEEYRDLDRADSSIAYGSLMFQSAKGENGNKADANAAKFILDCYRATIQEYDNLNTGESGSEMVE